MPVTVTRSQTRSVQPPASGATAPSYRVLDTCTAAVGVPQEIYVFSVSTGDYSHVATPADLRLYGTDLALARTQRKAFYRAASVTRDFAALSDASSFALDLDSRVQYLCDQFDVALDEFLGDGTPRTIVKTSQE